jgi:serine/threonine-protein kinase
MLELRTLGGLELRRRCDGAPQVIPLQLKRLVLLTYLAVAPERTFRRRDAILGLFWPERDEIHARGALRQALHSLRHSIGEGVILTRGEGEIGLDAAAITWDGIDLHDALARGEPASALARYHGDFLAGVFVSDASPALDEWIAVERARLRRVAATAAWAASALPGANGDAGQYVRRAVLLSGDDEEALRRGLVQLDRLGDRAGAVALYEEVALRVGRDLDVELSSETRGVMQTIRARRSPTPMPGPEPVAVPAPPSAVPPSEEARPDAPTSLPSAPRAQRHVVPVGVALLAFLVLVLALRRASARQPSASGDLIAILPFQVAADSSLTPLREGMVELLGARLSDGSGPRIADAPTVVSAWSDRMRERPRDTPHAVALEVARRVGAGRIIEGSAVRSGTRISLNARLATTEGAMLAQARVDGAPDSVPQLADRLAARLLGAMAGVDASRIDPLADGSLPAVRAYLAGHAALRQGRSRDAVLHFRDATELDSTFALAGLELARGVGWPSSPDRDRGVRIAEAGRDRLSPPDRVMLMALRQDVRSWPELFALWNTVVAAYPRRADAWQRLAELHFKLGPLAGEPEALDRAMWAMRTSAALASEANGAQASGTPAVFEAILQLVELAQVRHDTAMVRSLASRVLANDSTSSLARALRWHLAAVTSDSARRAFWAGSDPKYGALRDIGLFLTWTGIGAEEFPQHVADIRRLLGAHDPGSTRLAFTDIAYISGRPSEAPDAEISTEGASDGILRERIVFGLHWDGDTGVARAAARELARSAHAAVSIERVRNHCALGQWWAARGDFRSVDRAVAALRAARLHGAPPNDSAVGTQSAAVCAAVLDAVRAQALGLPDARARAASADSLARTLIFGVMFREHASTNLLLAQLWERHGDPARALQAVRRRGSAFLWLGSFMTSFLAEEGRLAALTGDTVGAVRAYRHYLALRFDPEPSVRPRVEQVRRALAALGEGNRRGMP